MEEICVNRCRACASYQDSSAEMMSLFENNTFKMFSLCTSLEIDSNDCLPNHICRECYGHLSNFSKFRQNCLESDILLRGQIETELIKAEPLQELLKSEDNENENVLLSLEENELNCDSTDFESKVSEIDIDEDFSKNDSKTLICTSNTAETTTYICDYCDQQFERKRSLGSHMVRHKNELVAKDRPTHFTCNAQGCKKIFKIKKSFAYHQLKVHGIDSGSSELCCSKCPKSFTIQYKLDAHIRAKHEGLKPYKCPHCEKEFTKHSRYIYHFNAYHNENVKLEKFRCIYDGCGKEYSQSDSLKAHIDRFHLGIVNIPRNQNLICEQCGKSFKDGFSLKVHSYTHSGVLPFPCKVCPKRFMTNAERKNHTMRRHLKIKKFVCTVCGVKKATNAELRAHLNYHTKEITFPCKECDRVFPSYGAIGRHVRIHHRNHKPYVCPHCQRAFAKAEVMKNHVMTHTGEKPFSCSQCGHRFIQAVALKKHMQVHTKNKNSR